MFEDVPLDTLEEFKNNLGEHFNSAYMPAINLILTRRNIKGCFQFSNAYIAQTVALPVEVIEAIDAKAFRPIQQIFAPIEDCNGCGHCGQKWNHGNPWTGKLFVHELHLPSVIKCTKDFPVDSMRIYQGGGGSWIYTCPDKSVSIILFRKSEEEIRMYVSGYPDIPRYHNVKTLNEMRRIIMYVTYVSGGRDAYLGMGTLPQSDPNHSLIQLDNWMTTPSLFWNEKIATLDKRIADLTPNRQEAVKIVTAKFKTQIESCASLSDFMDQYFPKISLMTLAGMCLAGEQPA